MDLRKQLLTKNSCYVRGDKMKPIGIVVHTTAANNPYISRYVQPDDGLLGKNLYNNHWNMSNDESARLFGRSLSKCVHAFVGLDTNRKLCTYQTLPWDMRGWHAGSGAKGSANDGYISWEICEDSTNNKNYAVETYHESVELAAYLVKLYPTIKIENIIGHYEAAAKGIASFHADPQHWWKKHGLSMEQFRKDVQKKVEAGKKPAPDKGDTMAELWRVKAGAEIKQDPPLTVDKAGAYTIVEKRGDWGKLKSGAGWINLTKAEYIRKI